MESLQAIRGVPDSLRLMAKDTHKEVIVLDFSTILGFLLGGSVLLAVFHFGGLHLKLLFQPEAALIVFGGTMTAVLLQSSFGIVLRSVKAIGGVFHKSHTEPEDILSYICEASQFIRQQGLLAIDSVLDDIEYPIIQSGLKMVVDNVPELEIRAQLTTQMEVAYQEQAQCADLFESAAGFAPTMGILGAVIGLIKTLSAFSAPEVLASGVASAFIATLYGVGSANLFLLPIAGKLRQRAKQDWVFMSMMLMGVLAIRRGENPFLIREKLMAFHTDKPGVKNNYQNNTNNEWHDEVSVEAQEVKFY